MDTAYAIFEHENSHWLSWILQPGYRHVWCVIPDNQSNSWIGIHLGRFGIEVLHIATLDFDVAAHYREEGADVVPVAYDPEAWHRLPMVMNSCVGLTKAVLGLNTFALTPLQLYRHLVRKIDHAPQSDSPRLWRWGQKEEA